jgi:hypothetical protein
LIFAQKALDAALTASLSFVLVDEAAGGDAIEEDEQADDPGEHDQSDNAAIDGRRWRMMSRASV